MSVSWLGGERRSYCPGQYLSCHPDLATNTGGTGPSKGTEQPWNVVLQEQQASFRAWMAWPRASPQAQGSQCPRYLQTKGKEDLSAGSFPFTAHTIRVGTDPAFSSHTVSLSNLQPIRLSGSVSPSVNSNKENRPLALTCAQELHGTGFLRMQAFQKPWWLRQICTQDPCPPRNPAASPLFPQSFTPRPLHASRATR